MKTNQWILLAGWIGTWISGSCLATNVGTSTMIQPVNLGAKSDPARIPMGAVGVISNYGYGTLKVISEARPCPDQPMRWEGGVEMNQNLASVFGISVEAGDMGANPKPPVILRVKPWKPPEYSPYTKEQALAATLWCLIQRAGGPPENPLVVQVITEATEDKVLEAKYSGKFVTRPGKDGQAVPSVQVPGTALETDARGITWVTFPDVKMAAPAPPTQPGMILFKQEGGDESAGTFYLLPVWGNGEAPESPLRLNQWSASICYPCFNGNGRTEANQLILERGSMRFGVSQEANGDRVSISYPRYSQETLAADLYALVLTTLPTEDHPLTVTIHLEETQLANYPAFRSSPGWTETKTNPTYNYFSLECRFVWDPVGHKLLAGSIPLVELIPNANFIRLAATNEPAGDVAKDLSKTILFWINEGIHDGTLTAEKNMADDKLSARGLQRQLGLAGYYEGLASYCNERGPSEEPMKDPVSFGESQLDQFHNMGWKIGRTRGFAILKARREAADTKQQKQ